MRKVRNQKGFTIMELMIVIVIIGILLAIAIPAYNSFRATAQTRACQSNMRTILSANGMYVAEYGTDAANTGALVTYMTNAATISCPVNPPVATDVYQIATGVVTCPNVGTNPAHVLP